MLQFPYMGTKQALAPIVADAARRADAGPFLDVFAGMCSVANAVQTDRCVWTNDLQCFAVTAAKSMLCDPVAAAALFDDFETAAREHYMGLCSRFRLALRHERLALASSDFDQFASRNALANNSIDRRSNRAFDLFSTTYANTYIGIEQAIEIDSLIFALNCVCGSPIQGSAVRRKFLFALGRTLLRVSTTTGHFAQYQTPSERNWKRFQRTRRLSVMELFRSDYTKAFSSAGPAQENNQAFNMDAISLLRSLRRVPTRPAVVYADPPYKQDQYSRYYHLLETLVLYDYPRVTGKAKYRVSRSPSVFSSKSKSKRGIEALSSLTSSLGADFILSYPEDGIADIPKDEMLMIMSSNFASVELVHEGILRHSTMGASKGTAKQPVIERIYLGRN
ncbi:MAG: DNA adenine methylase [Sphingopyxis sp.]|nr:DNA adenine methylase [Sphingopyxis sp.]